MAEITTTQAFSDGDTVTATKLNNITANAAIQTEAITNRSAETTVDQANDLLLMYDASATALKKVSLSNVIKAGTASNFPVTGNATIGGTLGVTGAITASSTVNGTTIPTSKTLVTTDDTQTLTGKTVNLSSNTLAGTLAQFNTSCSDADFASLAGSETLTNKTLTSPTINTGTISGGTINNAVIGGTTAAAGSFTTLSATSPITTQAGTASAPAIVPTGDTNTGIFFPAADTIAFSEGGTESMRIDSSGNVGIGASSPSQKLDVNGGSAIRGTIFIGDGSSSVIRKLTANTPLNFANSGGNTEMTIDSSGNVGIGTTSPARGLSIYKAGATSRLIIQSDVSGQAINNGLDIFLDQSNNAGVWNYQNASLFFATNNTERLRIDSNGNVGIGVSSPLDKLDVSGNLRVGQSQISSDSTVGVVGIYGGMSSNTSNSQLRFFGKSVSNTGQTYEIARISGSSFSGSGYSLDGGLQFSVASNNGSNVLTLTERLRIDSSGNVGIGTTSPTGIGSNYTTLDLRGSSGGGVGFGSTSAGQFAQIYAVNLDSSLRIQNTSASGFTQFTTNNTERLRITSGGAVGIYTPAGTNVLTLESASSGGTTVQLIRGINSSSGNFSGGAASFVVFTNGNVQNTNNSYGSLSDIKLKENIENASSQWNDIKSLQVRKFSFKNDQEHKLMLGLVAQEVELISPNLVETTNDTDKDGNDLGTITKGVKYSVLYMKAVKALQEAMERIEQLESKVAALEAA